jgi:hypothetical protein
MRDTAFWVPSDKTERFASCYQPTERCEILKNVLALLNSLPPRPRRRAKAWWRLDAAKLWHIYRSAIDVSAGISPGARGPLY